MYGEYRALRDIWREENVEERENEVGERGEEHWGTVGARSGPRPEVGTFRLCPKGKAISISVPHCSSGKCNSIAVHPPTESDWMTLSVFELVAPGAYSRFSYCLLGSFVAGRHMAP